MLKYEAIGFVSATHTLLKAAAAGDLTDEDEQALLDLEARAVDLLKTGLADLRIITDDGSGPGDDMNKADFFRLEPVVEIEVIEKSKLIEWPDGTLEKLTYPTYVAHSAPYKTGDREGRDYTYSGPEGFVRTPSGPKPFGAASALVARLLEAKAEGNV